MHNTYPIIKHNRNNNRFPWLIVLLILSVMVALGSIWGCTPKYTPERAEADIRKANDKQPATVADLTRKLYPCITLQADTILTKQDSIVYIDCPDLPLIVHEPGNTDTVQVTHTVKVPVHITIPGQTITKYIEDSAKIKSLQAQLDTKQAHEAQLQARIDVLQEQKDNWQGKARTRWWWIVGLAAVVAIITGVSVKKFFTPKVKI